MMVTRTYTLKSGKHFRRENGELMCYTAGDNIVLSEREATAIQDKLVIDVSPAPLVEVEAPKEPEVKPELTIKSTIGGKYNVINSITNKPVNEKPITKAEAEAIVGEGDEEE